MKSDRRHELKHNDLADQVAALLEQAKPYSKAVIGGCVALAVIVAAYAFLTTQSHTQNAASWNEYFAAVDGNNRDALLDVANRHPGSGAAHFARLRLADSYLAEGVDALFSDRDVAQDKLRLALENYKTVEGEAAPASVVHQRAQLGVARTHEARGDLDAARQSYQALAKIESSPYAGEAQRRHDDLQRQSTKEFYDWFAAQDVKREGGGEGEFGSGRRPGFEFDSLPDEPDMKSGLFEGSGARPTPDGAAMPAPDADAAPAETVAGEAAPSGDATTSGEAAPPSDAAPAAGADQAQAGEAATTPPDAPQNAEGAAS